jgi:predicted nucleic acid-binding protein
VWIDHLRAGDKRLASNLEAGQILIHPFVIGEIALGHLRSRSRILESLRELPMATVASEDEVMHLIDDEKLYGRGIGYIDAHLLASARLSGNAKVWTRDQILGRAAHDLGLASAER